MDNLQMSRQGTSYTEGDVSVAWGFGPGAVRDVVYVPPGRRTGRMRARLATGFLEETSAPITTWTPPGWTAPSPELIVRLSAPPADGESITFNADTGLFDPSPKVANISPIDLPENATPEDVAAAFNDLRVVLIEANVMEPDPS